MPRRDQLKVEQEHHKKAFEVYAGLPGKRSYERVASDLKVAVSTVKLWAKSFNWKQRLEEREAAVARQMADRVLESRHEDQDQYHKIVRMALLKVARAINSDKVKVQVADLDRLLRLEAFLREAFFDPNWPRSADELLERMILLWNRFSPEEQRAAMQKAFPDQNWDDWGEDKSTPPAVKTNAQIEIGGDAKNAETTTSPHGAGASEESL